MRGSGVRTSRAFLVAALMGLSLAAPAGPQALQRGQAAFRRGENVAGVSGGCPDGTQPRGSGRSASLAARAGGVPPGGLGRSGKELSGCEPRTAKEG